nr:unnamed protein product [Callosobruchus chinensis]
MSLKDVVSSSLSASSVDVALSSIGTGGGLTSGVGRHTNMTSFLPFRSVGILFDRIKLQINKLLCLTFGGSSSASSLFSSGFFTSSAGLRGTPKLNGAVAGKANVVADEVDFPNAMDGDVAVEDVLELAEKQI